MTITDIKNLIIKLDVAIDAEHEKVSANGLMLLMDFTEKTRKQLILQALDELTNIENKLRSNENE